PFFIVVPGDNLHRIEPSGISLNNSPGVDPRLAAELLDVPATRRSPVRYDIVESLPRGDPVFLRRMLRSDSQEILGVIETLVPVLLRILWRKPAIGTDRVAIAESSRILEDPLQISVVVLDRSPVDVVGFHAELGDNDLSVAVPNGRR